MYQYGESARVRIKSGGGAEFWREIFMSKSLQKGILFAVCILLVCALGVTLFLVDGTGTVPSVQEGQASAVAQNTATYTHGSKVKTAPSGARVVTNNTDFFDAIEKNQNIDLQANLVLTMPTQTKDWEIDLPNSEAFRSATANGVYAGTLYGNGHTISYNGAQQNTSRLASYISGSGNFSGWDLGGVINTLSGTIYDLNVVMTSGSMAFMAEDNTTINIGGIVGYMYGNARIENCTFTMQTNGRLAAGKESASTGMFGGSQAFPACGGIVGRIADSGTPTIVNCTVNMNGGTIAAGLCSGSSISGNYGLAGLVVGACWITANVDNIMVNGRGTLNAQYAANIGCTVSGGTSITTKYYYNNFNGTYSYGGSANAAWTSESGSASVANRILGPNTNDTSSAPKIANNSGYNVYFDPTSSDATNFLAIEFTGETYSPSQYDYSVTAAGNANVGGSFSASANGVLVRNLPATPSTWNSSGTFTANLVKTSKFDPTSYAKLTKYDHGYVDPDNRTTNGTAIGTGEDFEAVFSPSGTISGTDYYLTNDIVITGFTGKEFSGTLDGNGHTIFITGANTCAAQHIGGIVGTLTGTIKNVRVVLVNSVTANTSVSNANVGLVAGHINGGSLINVSVDIPADVTLKHTDSGNDSSLGGIAGSAVKGATVSGATFTNVTMNFNGTLSNIKTSGAGGGYWPFTSAFVGKPSVSQGTNSPANSATFNNIIIRGNGTFASQSSAGDEPPYYAAIGIIQHNGVTNSTAAVYNVNGLIYDFNPQFANDQGATTGNHGACYGLFVNNNNNNPGQVQYYDSLVNYGSGGVYNASGKVIEAYAFNEKGNAPVPNPDNIKNITETVTNVTGSTVKAYFMPGDSASTDLTLVASASNWNGVTQLQLDGAAPAVTSADDGSNKVVNVAKSTAVNISGENLTLSPYNPYTVITASLDNPTKVYDGNPFAAQVSFAVGGSPLEGLTEGDDYNITYTDGKATGETNANANNGTYSLTVTLTDSAAAADGKIYVFDAQGTKTKTFTYTITPLEVTGTWSVRGLEITYGDAAPDYDQYISIELTNEGTIPGGLTATDITGSGFTSNYTSGTRAGETVTITAGTFTVGSGFTASNYNFRGITGSGSVEVQKKELTISESFGDSMGHITDNYGENVTTFEALADLFEAEGMSYVEGLYGSDVVTFTVTALTYDRWYNDGADGAWEFNADASSLLSGRLYGNTAYNVGVELASDNSVNDNYELTNSIFVYAILPLPITVTGVELEGFDGDYIYDGNAHNISVKYDGALQGDELTFGISVSYGDQPFDGTALTNAGEYTIDVSFDPQNAFHGEANYNYEIGVDGSENTPYTLTITPKTLTPSPVKGTFTEYTSSNLPTGASFVTSGILESDSEVTVAVTSWVNDPSTNVVGSGSYVAVNTYTANLAIQGDTNNNYTLSADTATFTVEVYDLSQATITVEASGLVYDGTEKTATVTVKAGEADITDLVTITGNKATNAGDGYTVSISSKDDGNTTGSNDADTTWSIAKADYDMEGVTFENDSITYDGESHTLTISEDSLPTGADGIKVTVTYSAESGDVNITNAGSVTITATFATESGNYNVPAAKTATLTIVKKAVTIEWSIGDIIQGTDPDKVKATAEVTNNGGILDGDEYTFTVTLPLQDGSGDYTTTTPAGTRINVTPSLSFTDPTDEGNYEVTYNPEFREWTVQQPEVEISVTARTVEKTYAAGFVTEADFLSNFTGTFTATDAEADLTSANFDITITKQGADGTAVGVGRLDVGTYTVTISAAAGSQYTIAADSKRTYTYTVTAEQWTATVAAPEGGLTYNGLDQLSSLVITPGTNNTCAGAPIIAAVVADGEMKNAGTYTVTLQLKTAEGEAYEGDNFVLNSGSEDYSAQIEIAKLKVKIEWNTFESLVYTGSAFEMTAEITNKVTDDDVTAAVELSGDNIDVTADGFTYTVIALAGAAAENYTIEGVENIAVTYKILPATLTVAEGDATATFGEVRVEEGSLLNAISSKISGTVGEETLADIVSVSTFNTTVTWNDVAYYTANDSGSDVTVTIKDSNYTFAEDSNTATITLVINKLQDEINVTDEKSATYYDAYQANGANFFTVSTVSGFPVTIEWKDGEDTPLTTPEVGQPITWEVTTVYADVEVDYSGNEALAANFTAAQSWHSSSGFSLNNRDVTVKVDLQSMDKIYDGNGFENFNVITAFYDDGSDTTPVPQTELEIEVQKGFDGRIDPANAIAAGEYSVYIQGDRLDVTIVYANEKKTFTIEKATLTLTAAEGATLSRDYDGNTTEASTFVSDAYVTVGGYVDVDGSVYDLLTATVAENKTIKNADTYTITFALTNADGNYALAAFDGFTYTIDPKTLTAGSVVWTDPADYTYNGLAIAPTAAWASGAIVTGDTVNITITISAQDGSEITDNQAINAGSYTAAATIAAGDASGNYKLVADVTHNFTIARKAVTITWTDGGEGNFVYTYDGTAKAPTASVTEGAPEGTFDNINTLVTIDGIADNQAINAGSYTATITKEEFETAYPNYTIVEDSAQEFTIDPATISVSLSASGDNVENNTITLNVSGKVTASEFVSGQATLTEGENTVTITAAAADGATLPTIYFTLDGELYTGTAYGTKVEGGELSVATANTNYKITVTQPLTLNITPSIVVQVKEEALKTAEYNYSKTYSADDFTGYFEVVGSDGSPVTGGSREVTITNEEGGSVVQIKNAGTYTITYTYTPADWSGSNEDKPSTSYTFTITPATVRQISIASGEKHQYDYGELKKGSTITVTVTYSDNSAQDITATFTASMSSGGYVNAGNNVTLTLTGSSSSANYENLTGRETDVVFVGIFKAEITAVDVYYANTHAEGGVLTLPYNGSSGYDSIFANATSGVLAKDVVELTVTPASQIVGVNTYALTIALAENGDYANYELNVGTNYSVEITPAEITVDWGDTTEFTYNGSEQAPVPTATGTFNNDVVNLGDKVIVTEQGGSESVTPINAGTYTATVAAFTEGNYKLSEDSFVNFTIGKADATLSIKDYESIKDKAYDSAAVTIATDVTLSGGGQVTADVAVTIMLNGEQVNEVRNAGTYSVTLSIANNNNINDVTSEAFTFTISKASVSVSGTLTTQFTYNGSAVDIDAIGASASKIYGNEATLVAKATLNGEPAEMKNAGTYSVTFTLEGEGAGNYELTTTDPVSVTINAKTVTITWGETTFTYNGEAQLPTASVTTDDGLVDGDTIDLSGAVTLQGGGEAINANADGESYTAVVTVEALEAANPNYTMSVEAITDFTIARRQVEITWTDETFIYNGTAQAPTFTVKNLVEGDELELTAAITGNVTDGEAINAGDYIATIAAFTQGNYTLASASTKTFTIGKANLTLDPASVTFSEKDEDSLAAYSESGYSDTIKGAITVTGVAGEITEYTVTTEATFTEGLLGVGAHTFTITAGDNYNTATYTVTVTAQQTITITAKPSSGTYTGSEITFEYAPSDSSVDISGLTITVATVNGSADGAVLNAGSYTVTFTVNNSDEAVYWYEVRDWTGTIAAAEVTVTEATLSAIYGEVYTAEATGVAVQNVNGWSVATFNGAPVEATVAIDQTATAAALPGETSYLRASETAYNVIITLTSDNFKFADTVSVSGNSKQMATTLTVEKKELDVTTSTDLTNLTYTSEGVVIEIADISEDIVGSDDVTVTIMVDGEPYEPGVTVLSAGEHTITYAISGNGNGNYAISADSAVGQTFTIAPKAASGSITVSGERVESGSTVEITTGENLRVDTAINNYIAQNGVAEGEYTVTATDSQGNEVDIDRVSSWAPGDYTISVNLGENFSGGEMTFTISVAAGTTTEIPDPPTTPSTPIVDDGGSGNNWLFPLIIAIECVIALALIAAIVITAIKRSKNA